MEALNEDREQVERGLAALAHAETDPNPTMAALAAEFPEAPDWTTDRQVPFTSERRWSGASFTDQTQLLEDGILSSLDIVEFVLFIESLRGEDVDVEDIEPAVFTSIETLYGAFFTTA